MDHIIGPSFISIIVLSIIPFLWLSRIIDKQFYES